MSTTVIETLENARANFKTAEWVPALFPLAMEQLENAIEALENGRGPDDVIQEHASDDAGSPCPVCGRPTLEDLLFSKETKQIKTSARLH